MSNETEVIEHDAEVQPVTAVAVKTESIQAITVTSQADQFLTTIRAAASDASTDMDKMERLYAMYKDIKDTEAKAAYNTSMALAQGEMGCVEKKHWNPQTESLYAKVEDVISEIKPIWVRHGFSLSFYEGEGAPEGWVMAMCDVSHSGGDTRTFRSPMPIDDKGIKGSVNKTQIHGIRSAKTYAQRYLLGDIFSLEIMVKGQDNDGNMDGKQVETITEQQALEIHAKLTDHNIPMQPFLKWLVTAVKAESIEGIQVNVLDIVNRRIDSAIRAKEKASG